MRENDPGQLVATVSWYSSIVDSGGTTMHILQKLMKIISQSINLDTMIVILVPSERMIIYNILGDEKEFFYYGEYLTKGD